MTKDEALKLALEALETKGEHHPRVYQAITAIKEALAQPEQDGKCKYCTDGCPACDARKLQEQEPVATLWQHGETGRTRITMPDDITDCDARWFKAADLYTTPPQRKPLTENEIKHFWYEACQTNLELTSQLIVHLARNIEAAHGIKGEA